MNYIIGRSSSPPSHSSNIEQPNCIMPSAKKLPTITTKASKTLYYPIHGLSVKKAKKWLTDTSSSSSDINPSLTSLDSKLKGLNRHQIRCTELMVQVCHQKAIVLSITTMNFHMPTF